MVNGEDDMEIMDGQYPFLLVFEPLRLLKRAALWTVPILARLIAEFPAFAFIAFLPHAPHGRRAAIQDGAHSFRLRIRKPMSAFVIADVFAEDVSQIEARMFGSQTVSN